MKQIMSTPRAITAIFLLSLLLLSACDHAGIFGEIAVSEKIAEGLLPEGASPSRSYNINGGTNAYYDYISTGPALWSRNVQDRSTVTTSTRWRRKSLTTSDGISWEGVQDIAGSDGQLLLALYRLVNGTNRVGLYYLVTDTDGDYVSLDPVNPGGDATGQWPGNVALKVFCPDPSSTQFYVSVLNYTGNFDDDSKTFSSCDFYSLNNPSGLGTLLELTGTGNAWDGAGNLSNLDDRYVSGMASDGGTTILTAVNNAYSSGVLLNASNGAAIDYDGSTIACRGLTWLPDKNAFIMSGNVQDGTTYPLYVSTDGTTWSTLSTGTANPIQSFLDVSQTQTGGTAADKDDRVLAGTKSIGSKEGYGYTEINSTDGTPANWTVLSSSELTFALPNNYLVSDLRQVSTSLSMYQDSGTSDWYVYAGTAGEGFWRINADDYTAGGSSPSWTRE